MTFESTEPAICARETRDAWVSGRADIVACAEQRLAHAKQVEARIHAFACLDEGAIRLQAERLQALRGQGAPLPAMYGVPVAIKDIIDTADFPTALGSPIHDGRRAAADATVVRRLREAGALIFGKTVTTEFATLHPGPTRNPHDLERTPGGSSSGSAAAEAAGVVPLAVGTQTNGSMLRPASFCGVHAYKPTLGLLPRTGVFPQSPSLDQIGVFARCVEDLAWAAEPMSGDDGHDAASSGLAPKALLAVCCSEPPVAPRFGFLRTPWWSQVDADARAAYSGFIEVLRGLVTEVEMPAVVVQTPQWIGIVNEAELAHALRHEFEQHADALSPGLRQRVERGRCIPVLDYLAARGRMPEVASAFGPLFAQFDALLCPAALGAAPRGLESTGNPIMQTVWSFGGMPAVSLPLLRANGLPLGVQVVGARHDDARLLRAARWLEREFRRRAAA